MLAGFTGALHTDGYSGYAPAVREQGLVHLACWAHARRGFTDTLKSLGLNPNKLPPAPPAKARRALSVLHRIRTLYAIERRIRDTPPDQRHRTRQAESVPVLNALRAWPDDTLPKVLPSGPLGKAMRYLDNQWNALVRFCDDGRYGIDTNPVENAIRPFCLGRRNWLFADTVPGANASARLDSLIETAKACPRESGGPTHSNPTPTCVTCSPNCPRHDHSPRSKLCCRPGSTPPPSLDTRSKAPLQAASIAPFPGRLRAFRGRRHALVREPDAGDPHVRFDERGVWKRGYGTD